MYVALRTSTKVDVDTLALSGGARVAERPGPSHRPRLYVGFFGMLSMAAMDRGDMERESGPVQLVVEPRWFNHTISSPKSTTDCFGSPPSPSKIKKIKIHSCARMATMMSRPCRDEFFFFFVIREPTSPLAPVSFPLPPARAFAVSPSVPLVLALASFGAGGPTAGLPEQTLCPGTKSSWVRGPS